MFTKGKNWEALEIVGAVPVLDKRWERRRKEVIFIYSHSFPNLLSLFKVSAFKCVTAWCVELLMLKRLFRKILSLTAFQCFKVINE